jgi:dolichol kinase
MKVTWHRLRIELWRKGIHLCTGLAPIAYALWLDKKWVLAMLGLFSAVMIAVELARRGDNALARLFRAMFAFMLRKKEREGSGLLGATPYCLASLLCVLVFPKAAAVLALLYLAIGDTAASFVGLAWGRRRIGDKTLEGFLAFWAAAGAVALVARWCSPEYALVPALVAAPVAGVAELFTAGSADNWVVPLTAGVTIVGVGMLV